VKILQVTPSFYPASYWGGPSESVYGLSRALASSSEIRVLTTDTSGPRVADRLSVDSFPVIYPEGFQVYYCRKRAGVATAPSLFWWIWPLVRWADVVHLTAVYSFPTLPTLIACRLLGKPLVWSPRGTLQRWQGSKRRKLKGLWEALCRLFTSKINSVGHFTSEEELKQSRGRLNVSGVLCVPNGIKVPACIERQPRLKGLPLKILYLGRLDRIKGIENLLNAIALLEQGAAVLQICGSGEKNYESSLKSLARELRLDAKVEFVGHVDGDQKEAVLQWADLMIVPSHQESFGMVVVEALARSLPVIASKGTPWAGLEHNGCGLWIEGSPEGIADAIRRAAEMDLIQMGRRGREWVVREFSWESVSARMLAAYANLVTGKRI
jgi:glycosyltransferase involved in cell wall biosynthesis